MSAPATTDARPTFGPLDIVRFVVVIAAFASLALWGFLGFEFPLNLVFGLGAPIVAILVWALFVSPRAVLRVHPFIRAFVELLVFAAATLAWWDMGQAIVGIGFAVVAIASGLLSGLRNIA